MRDGGSEHLEEVVMHLELLILDEVSNTLYHNHLVRTILEQDVLRFKRDNILGGTIGDSDPSISI